MLLKKYFLETFRSNTSDIETNWKHEQSSNSPSTLKFRRFHITKKFANFRV